MALADSRKERGSAVDGGVAEGHGDVASGDDVFCVEAVLFEIDEEACSTDKGNSSLAFLGDEEVIGDAKDGHFLNFNFDDFVACEKE